MDFLIITLASLLVAALTLFSGFGLGTLLMPVFALFFPLEIAVAATALVHLANNIFKLMLMGRHAHFKTVLKFGIPALLFAVMGALLLNVISNFQPLLSYQLGQHKYNIEYVKLIIALLMVAFAIFEVNRKYASMTFESKFLPFGGALSGFFGGLSGHQGALRAAFLSKLGFTKEQFIGTSVVTAVMVDVFRLAVYGFTFLALDTNFESHPRFTHLVIVGTFAAFVGSFVGVRLVKKITMRTIQVMVSVLLILLAIGLATGIV